MLKVYPYDSYNKIRSIEPVSSYSSIVGFNNDKPKSGEEKDNNQNGKPFSEHLEESRKALNEENQKKK